MKNNIEDLIVSKIENIAKEHNIYHKGKVVRINSFIIEATGLEDAFFFEKVYIGDEENVGYVDKIEENKVYIALVKTNGNIKIGDTIKTTGEALQASFSKNAMGMIVDTFGVDRISGKNFNDTRMIPIETEKIGIMERATVNRPLETGISSIDLMFPIGRGQRQLIIGDKKTGKTQILLDTIVNQKGKNMLCIYVSIGKTKKEIKRLYTKLVEKGANAYTQIVAAFNDDTSPMIKLTPYVGLSIAEEYMKEGKDVLVCIDDLKKHADACREIALIAEKNTGREAYPADIFYTHSRLLEKGCQHKNGGSITILPVVETKGGDITDYISTNIISITDGQIVLSEKNFKKGQKPALNFGLSVSRLGGSVQKPSIKTVGAVVRRELLSYLETADVYQLVNVDSMSPELQEKIFRGKKILDLLKQPKFAPRSEEKMIETFSFVMSGSMAMLQEQEQTKDDNNQPPKTKGNKKTKKTTKANESVAPVITTTETNDAVTIVTTSGVPMQNESNISQIPEPVSISMPIIPETQSTLETVDSSSVMEQIQTPVEIELPVAKQLTEVNMPNSVLEDQTIEMPIEHTVSTEIINPMELPIEQTVPENAIQSLELPADKIVSSSVIQTTETQNNGPSKVITEETLFDSIDPQSPFDGVN